MSRDWARFVIFVAMVPASLWSAFVAMKLWVWFAVPAGAPSLSVMRFAGLGLLIGLYRHLPDEDPRAQRKGEDVVLDFVGRGLAVPAFLLLLGWVYAQFL